jgi:pilus assembly protein Flp/PilA
MRWVELDWEAVNTGSLPQSLPSIAPDSCRFPAPRHSATSQLSVCPAAKCDLGFYCVTAKRGFSNPTAATLRAFPHLFAAAAWLIKIKGPLMFKLIRFLQDDDGATATEYAVMLGLIMVVCLTAIGFFGSNTNGSLGDTSDKLQSAMNP